jgi:hypothetical protein
LKGCIGGITGGRDLLLQLLEFELHEQYVNPTNYKIIAVLCNLPEVPRNVFLFMYRAAFISVLYMYASFRQLLTKYLLVSLNRRKRFRNIGFDWRLILKWTLQIEISGDMDWIHLAQDKIHSLALVKVSVKFLVASKLQSIFNV